MRFAPPAFVLCVVLAACGGGGGGSSAPPTITPPNPTPTNVPTTTPTTAPTATAVPTTAAGGFVAASGPITQIANAQVVSGNFGSTLLAGSSGAEFVVQAGTTPGNLSSATLLAQSTVAVSETAGLSTSSLARGARSVRSEREIAEARAALAADGLHEINHADWRAQSAALSQLPVVPASKALQSVRRPQAVLGDTRQFSVQYSGIGGASTTCPNPVANFQCYVSITATLKGVGKNGYVWVDNTALNNASEFPDQSVFQTTANNFDSYFATETATFGQAFASANINYQQCDSNGTALAQNQYTSPADLTGADPHINLVVTDVLQGTGEGGYFYSLDLFNQNVVNCIPGKKVAVNGLPMFVMTGAKYTAGSGIPPFNSPFWVSTDAPRTASHELQHYLHYINKGFIPSIPSGRGGVSDDAWIDEGCSMLAEDIAANGTQIDTPRYSFQYLLEPSQYSLTAFVGFQPDVLSTTGGGSYKLQLYTGGNYGMAYLMMRYVYDRFGVAGLKRLYADFRPGGGSGQSNVNPVLAAANGLPWQQLYSDWSLAVAAQSSGVTTDSRYTFNSAVVLRGNVQVPSVRSAPLNIRNLTFGGPQPPRTFDGNSNPTGYLSLTPGATTSISALDGATNFYAPVNTNGGATVRASTGTLGSPQGGVVQGTLPSPQPTSF